MEFSIKALSPETAKTRCVVVGVHGAAELTPPARRLDQASRGALRPALGELPLSASAPLQAAVREAVATADGADLAKTLGNLPPNICTPTYLAAEAAKIAKEHKLGIDVLERRDMEKLGMGALLSVTRGSHQPPKMIVLRYFGGAKSNKPLLLARKAITSATAAISPNPP